MIVPNIGTLNLDIDFGANSSFRQTIATLSSIYFCLNSLGYYFYRFYSAFCADCNVPLFISQYLPNI